MKKKGIRYLLLILILMALNQLITMSETVKCNLFSATAATSPIPESTKMNPEQEIMLFKEKYVKVGDTLLSGKKYQDACITYQKILDILFRKSIDSNFDAWMGSYGKFYKQIDLKQKRARTLYEESRKRLLEKIYEKKKYELISSSPPPLKVIKRKILNGRMKGSLSGDGDIILSSLDTESPPVNPNHIIGFYLAESGEKLFDDTPIPDDRKNPQIHRWGHTYLMQDPVWSPDSTRYAYTINGALCVNDDSTGRPALISNIADNKSVNDTFCAWSLDGKKLLYIRTEGKTKTVFCNNLTGENEQKIMQGEKACFSIDSQKIAVIHNSKIFIYFVKNGKNEQISIGNEVIFSPSNEHILVGRVLKEKQAYFLKNINDGTEKELFNSQNPAFAKREQTICKDPIFLSRNLLAFNLFSKKEGRNIWIFDIETSNLTPLTRDGNSLLREWFSTPSEIATQKEVLYLSR